MPSFEEKPGDKAPFLAVQDSIIEDFVDLGLDNQQMPTSGDYELNTIPWRIESFDSKKLS